MSEWKERRKNFWMRGGKEKRKCEEMKLERSNCFKGGIFSLCLSFTFRILVSSYMLQVKRQVTRLESERERRREDGESIWFPHGNSPVAQILLPFQSDIIQKSRCDIIFFLPERKCVSLSLCLLNISLYFPVLIQFSFHFIYDNPDSLSFSLFERDSFATFNYFFSSSWKKFFHHHGFHPFPFPTGSLI